MFRLLQGFRSVARGVQAQTDVDGEGRLFVILFLLFFGAAFARGLLIAISPVPLNDPGAASSFALCFLMAGAATLTQWRGHREGTLLLRAGAIALLATPWTLSACSLVFNVGRGYPLVDSWLAAADRTLGFDWLTYTRAIDATPWLWTCLRWAYRSILYQPQIICIILAFTRSACRLYALICALLGALAVVACVAVFMPAVGTHTFYGSPAGIVHFGDLMSPDGVAGTIRWLRNGPFSVPLQPMPLITFPSFHAASAVIFIWALWRTPVLKWGCLGLNLAMLAATPALGCHYLIDIIVGGAIGGLAALAAHAGVLRLARELAARETDASQPESCPDPMPVGSI